MKLFLLFSIISLANSFSFRKGMVRQVASNRKEKNSEGKSYIIDIDGTICFTEKSDYYNSIPNYEKIEKFNKLYDEGNKINYWTARGAVSGKNWDEFTVKQLNNWNVKYTTINMDKPHYDVWIDDKAINIDDI